MCIACCYGCEYLAADRIICRYHVTNVVQNPDETAAVIRRQAEHKKRQAAALRRRGTHFAAYKVEEEWRAMWHSIRELEERNENRA